MRELDLSQKQRSRIRDASSTSTFRWQIKNSMFVPSSFFVEEFRLHLNETRIHPRSKRGLKLLFKRISTFFLWYFFLLLSLWLLSRPGLVIFHISKCAECLCPLMIAFFSIPHSFASPLIVVFFFSRLFFIFSGHIIHYLGRRKKTSSNKIHFYTLQTIVSRTVVIQWRVREYQTSPRAAQQQINIINNLQTARF